MASVILLVFTIHCALVYGLVRMLVLRKPELDRKEAEHVRPSGSEDE